MSRRRHSVDQTRGFEPLTFGSVDRNRFDNASTTLRQRFDNALLTLCLRFAYALITRISGGTCHQRSRWFDQAEGSFQREWIVESGSNLGSLLSL